MLFHINDVKLQSQTSRVVRCGQVCRTHTWLPLLQKTSNNVRLGMINNPSAAPSAQTTRVARAIWAAMQTQSANNAKNFITKLTKEETAAALESGTDIAEFAVGVGRGGRGGRVKIACYVFRNTHSVCLPRRAWTLRCSRRHTKIRSLTSCSPTPPTAGMCSN